MRHRIARQRGFTLLEVLVTLVVLGLLMVTLSEGLRAGLKAWALGGRMGLQSSGLEATDHALRQLIERASPENARSHDGGLSGNAHSLSFTTTLPEGYGAPATHEADVTLLLGEGHRLELLWRPHYSRWIVTPPPPAAITLVEGVQQLDLGYWQPGTGPQQGHWLTNWSTLPLPPLVRLRIIFPPGDERRWPDIVVAPMQERPSW